MKTHVIQPGPQDDLISVRDQMTWAKTSRIILVFPPRTHLLSRDLDLRLLKRHAGKLGAKLALVGRQKDIGRSAKELQIPVFSTVKEAQLANWEIYGEKVSMGFFHDFSGFRVFALAFIALYGVSRGLERRGCGVRD